MLWRTPMAINDHYDRILNIYNFLRKIKKNKTITGKYNMAVISVRNKTISEAKR